MKDTLPRAETTSSPASPEAGRSPVPPPAALVDALIRVALAEDGRPVASQGSAPSALRDLTSEAVLGPEVRARARLVSKATGCLAGLDVAARVFELCDPDARIERLASDGDALAPGQELLRVTGRARGLLFAERTALNFVQRLSGIATLTARCVERSGGRARILDTRKTTPGLRLLEKYAVRCGGGGNHRFGLHDEVLVKNNHLDLAGASLAQLLPRVRASVGAGVRITAEARDEREAFEAVAGGADVILLDNFAPEQLARLGPRLRASAGGRPRPLELEASGGIGEHNVAAYAASGVDRISIGALTHSAPALDLSLGLEAAE